MTHPYLRYLAAWDRDEVQFLAALSDLAGVRVRFAGVPQSPRASVSLSAFIADPMAAITEAADGTLLLPGNPHTVLRQLQAECATRPRERGPAWVPGAARRFFAGDGPGDGSAPAWPDEPRVDRYRRALFEELLEERGASGRDDVAGEPLSPPWAGGQRFAVCLTFQVAEASQMPLVGRMLEEYKAREIPTTYFLESTPSWWDHGALEAVRQAGGEVALLGLGRRVDPLRARAGQLARRLTRLEPVIEQHAITGWRCPEGRISGRLVEALGARLAYDSSLADCCRPGESRLGCAVTTPFRLDGVLEVPVTVPADTDLQRQGVAGLDFLELMRGKAMEIRQRYGVVVLSISLDPALGGGRIQRDLLGALMGDLFDTGDGWFTTPGVVAAHWNRCCRPDS